MRHRVRELMVGQRTATINALRSHLSEIGVVAAQGVLARKLLIALWRFVIDGVMPEGAVMKPSI